MDAKKKRPTFAEWMERVEARGKAHATLVAMLDQEGCEGFDPSHPRMLTDLCDIIIYG